MVAVKRPMKTVRSKASNIANELGLNEELMYELIDNAITSRAQLIRRFTDPRRDIDDECGYPNTGKLYPQDYEDLFEREPVAARVVQVFAKESWQTQPCVYENEDEKVETMFEKDWKEFSSGLTGFYGDTDQQTSWYKNEEAASIWSILKRVDELSGIGHYGIILLGFNDGRDLSKPVAGFREFGSYPIENEIRYRKKKKGRTLQMMSPKNRMPIEKHKGKMGKYRMTMNLAKPESINRLKVRYMRVFPESLAPISKWESNPNSPRFGQPVAYNVTLTDPKDIHAGQGVVMQTVEVHWTRIIHIADNLQSSEVFGVPRMRPVLNALLDIRKVRGGSAEMYWKGAFPGISFETHPVLGTDVKIDREAMRTMAENYMNGLQRFLALSGMTAKSLSPQVEDPTPQLKAQIQAICIYLGIPERVFMGSERGQLASNQDDSTWMERLMERQNTYLTPKVIVPLVDRLIMFGVLRKPVSGQYRVFWPDRSALTDKEKTVIAVGLTKAISQFHKDGLMYKMTFLDFLTRIIGLDARDAKAIIENRATEPLPKESDPNLQPKLTTPSANGKPSPRKGGTSGEDKVPKTVRTKVPRYGRRKSQDYAGDTTTRA